MMDKVTVKTYEIVKEIKNSKTNKKLGQVKEKIKKDEKIKKIIKDFNSAKTNYERYNLKEEFKKAKKTLLENEVIGEYIDIQNQINLLTIKINNRIKRITDGVTKK